MNFSLSLALALSLNCGLSATDKDPQLSPYAGAPGWQETKTERTKWFKDAKFGMFIHWGLYTSAAGYWPPVNGKKYPQHYAEWIRHWSGVTEPSYGNLTKPLFQPDLGCTDEWAKVAKEAGMQYTVLTTKHHEGYTLFNSKAAYSVKNKITGSTNISPKGRDMVAEYADSVRKQGLKVGYYYSLIDWQHPHALKQSRRWPIAQNADHEIYVKYMQQHVKELFSNYGKSDILWVDYSSRNFQGSSWGTKSLLTEVLKKQPQVITNNRFWNGLQNDYGDFFTPEKYVPATGSKRAFEVCHTMNESFGYSAHDNKWRSTKDTVHMLVDIVSKGGNLLLNVGPDAKGHIPKESMRILRETGQWLKVHGDAIYGTSASPFKKLLFDGRCTSKVSADGKSMLYFHLLDWPANGEIKIAGLMNEVLEAKLLGSDEDITFVKENGQVMIKLPENASNKICSVVAVEIKGQAEVDQSLILPQQNADRSVMLKAADATLKGDKLCLENDSAHVGYWIDKNASVSFKFNVHTPGPINAGGVVTHKPGKYAVYITQAVAENHGGTLALSIDGQEKFTSEISSTGSWKKFERRKIGEVTLSKKGKTIVMLKTKSMKTALMNLQSLELEPLDK